ncbi:MAG: type IV secretion system protein [Rickettsiales bacterium]|nr:type IV secretion system protein [Rickettsiales bacterium]
MNLAEKIAKIFAVIFFAFLVASCDSGCVEADQFDGNYSSISSNPGASAITGDYLDTPDSGGQQVTWTDTGFRSNGDKFVIQITGSWLPWFGSSTTGAAFNNLERCNFCAKKDSIVDGNCLCYKNQISEPEISADGYTPVTGVDCSGADQNDPKKCTCTKTYGVATAYTAYHVPLNYEDKYGHVLTPNDQSICKYDGGMGLYLGLFGRNGVTTPIRVYHLFTESSVCDIALDSNGECKDEDGKDVTKYMFKSAHDKIFVKDDNKPSPYNNNTDDDGYDNGTATFHTANEHVKLVIYDSYYLDNNGSYNVNFFKGVGKADDTGLLEYLVGLVEDTVLGKIDSSTCVEIDSVTHKRHCQREGGIIRYMYLSIVQDSLFITVLQILLSMYIAFYGLATLLGLAAITKKELTTRVLKIGLIIFFTSPTSWSFYNDIIVSFFKDSMDYVIGLFMDLSDGNLNDENTSIIIAQMERATDVSNATRFSFIDLTIKKLMSLAAAKKIFGLFFGSYFGILYILAIYASIAYFIYVVLLSATFYIINVIKIAFVLSLGPVFMCFSLFAQTNPIFKRWISYVGSRSLEILFLFIFLYNFIVIIDREFVSMLSYRACVEMWGIPFMKIPVLKSYIDRSLVDWCISIVTVGGLIFIMQMVVNQIPMISGNLITIGGDANKDRDGVGRGQSGMNLANKIMGGSKEEYGVYDVARIARQSTIGGLKFGAGAAVQGGTQAYRAVANSALGQAVASSPIGKAFDALPNSPITRYRNSIIDTAINEARSAANSKGLTGVKADAFIRTTALSKLQQQMHRNYAANKPDGPKTYDPTGMKLAGVNMTSIVKRFDEVLVKEPLKNFIKKESEKMNKSSDPIFGKERQERLKEKALQFAESSFSGGRAAAQEHLGNLNSFIKKQSVAETSDAAKSVLNNEDAKSRYLQHLKDNEISLNQKIEENKYTSSGRVNVSGRISNAYRVVQGVFNRNDKNNPVKEREIFLRKLEKLERMDKNSNKGGLKGLKGIDRITKPVGHARDKLTGNLVFGRLLGSSTAVQSDIDAQLKSLRESVRDRNNIIERDKKSVEIAHLRKTYELDKSIKSVNERIAECNYKMEKNEESKQNLIKDKEEREKMFKESRLGERNSHLKDINILQKKIDEISKNQKSLEKEKEALEAKSKRLLDSKKLIDEGIKREKDAIDEREKLINSRRKEYEDHMKQIVEKDIDDALKSGQDRKVLLAEAENRLYDVKNALIMRRKEDVKKSEKELEKAKEELEKKKLEAEKLKDEDAKKAQKEVEDLERIVKEKRLEVKERERIVMDIKKRGSDAMNRVEYEVETVNLSNGKEVTMLEEIARIDYLNKMIEESNKGRQANIVISSKKGSAQGANSQTEEEIVIEEEAINSQDEEILRDDLISESNKKEMNEKELEQEEELQLEEVLNEREEKDIENVLKESELKLQKIIVEKINLRVGLNKITKVEVGDVLKEIEIISEIVAEKNGQGAVDRNNSDYAKYLEMSSEDLKKSFDIAAKIIEVENRELTANKIYEVQKAKMALIQVEKKYINFHKNSKNNDTDEDEESIRDEILIAKENLSVARMNLIIDQQQYLEIVDNKITVIEATINGDIAKGNNLEEVKKKLEEMNNTLEEIKKDKDVADDYTDSEKADNTKKDDKLDKTSSDKRVLKDSYSMDKELTLSKAKLAKLKISVKKEELKILQAKDAATLTAEERVKVSTLENDITSLQSEVESHTSEARNIDAKITSLDS